MDLCKVSTAVTDAEGDAGVTWSTFAKVWAAVEPPTGSEYLAAAQMQSAVSHLVRLRYLPRLTTDMRVHDAITDLYLHIQAVINSKARRMLHLMCQSRRFEAI